MSNVQINVKENDSEDEEKTVQEVFEEFCSQTTIHGIRYIAERKRHWTERLWWLIAFCCAVFFCGWSIRNFLVNWDEHMVAINFAEKPASISEIPFPAVTVCVKPKAYLSRLDLNLTEDREREYLNLTKSSDLWKQTDYNTTERFEQAKLLSLICRRFTLHNKDNYTNDSFYDIMQKIAPSFSNIFSWCKWNAEELCMYDFTPVFTQEGICYSFNSLNSNEMYTEEMTPALRITDDQKNVTDWTMENGYTNKGSKKVYPLRLFNAKPSGGLELDLRLSKQDLDFDCFFMKSAYRIFLHTPGEVPATSRDVIQVAPLEIAEYAIKATLITTSEGLRRYAPSERQCFFNSDRQLRFYKMYTKNNCESECLANFTKQNCGCVQFFMPRDNKTKICGGVMEQCYIDASNDLFGEDLVDGLEDDIAREFRRNCNCLPACTSISYDIADRTQTFNQIKVSDYERNEESIVSIYFKSPEVNALRRAEVYTFSNFLAICGGLLGLFLGVSALSVIEFIYYFTLRLVCNIRHWEFPRVLLFKPSKF